MILKLNADASPAVVLDAFTFDSPIHGLAFKSGALWILTSYVGPKLVVMDRMTGTVQASYALPRDRAYQSLAVLGDALYALRPNASRTASDVLVLPGL